MSDNNSVTNDEEVVQRMHKTPNAPIKVMSASARRRVSSSGGCRALFRAASPASTSSGGLGHMSPLSSSLESLQSIDSTSFSPNGHFKSPVATPQGKQRDISIHSSLFPVVKTYTPKTRRSIRLSESLDSPNIRESMAVLQDMVNDDVSSQVSTPRSSRRRIVETMTSPSSPGTPPSQKKRDGERKSVGGVVPASPSVSVASNRRRPLSEIDFYGKKQISVPRGGVISASPSISEVATLTQTQILPKSITDDDFYGKKPVSPPIKALSDADFYGPPKISPLAPPKRPLVIDTIAVRGRRVRRDSEASQRSFVSGNATKRQRSASRSSSRSNKKHKGMIPGVWHSIKKPKKIKRANKKKQRAKKLPKPTVSPNARLAEMLAYGMESKKESKALKLFEAKPKKRNALEKSTTVFSAIVDSFPEPLIKRTKLPTSPAKPDPSKKIVKYSTTSNAKAKFTLGNMKFQYKPKEGEIGLQSPEKRRRVAVRPKKLYTPQLDPIEFHDDQDENSQTSDIVNNILAQLEDAPSPKPPSHVEKISDGELISILESPSTRVSLIPRTPRKVLTEITQLNSSPQRSLSNHMSNLVIADPDRLPLGATGNVLAAASNILNNVGEGSFSENSSIQAGNESGVNGSPCNKLYPVFDRSNWTNNVFTELTNVKKDERKKTPLVPDDQYLLDAGQNSIGIVSCKECGVMYQAGDYLDELAHFNVHNHLHELRFPGWKDERVVSRFEDGRIVIVNANDQKLHQDKAKKVVGVVDAELGFSENTLVWSPDKKILLYINEKKKLVIGCLVSENCTKGYRMYPPIEGVDVDTCARDSTPCKIGVSRIWTALGFRRQGVASRLFSCLRRISGDVAADDVAFSIPSPAGKELAKNVIGRQDFKVYGFVEAQ